MNRSARREGVGEPRGALATSNGGHRGALMAIVIALALSASARSQCQYESHGWSPFPCGGPFFTVYTGIGLNDLGAWCGYRLGCTTETNFPVYCPPGGMPQVLPMPAGTGTDGAQALALNNTGIVVGWYRRPPWNLDSACAWLPDGRVIDLFEIGPGDRSVANAVNDSGVIVGVHFVEGGNPASRPFIWKDGTVTFLDPLPFYHGKALAIADSGVVAGILGSETINARAFRWSEGKFTVLPPLAGFAVSRARGMNEQGWIVGDSAGDVPGVGWVQVPTLWIDDTPIELPPPAGYASNGAAGKINEAGVIVGSFASSGPQLPAVRVVWVNGEATPLNHLTLPGSPSVGLIAAINDSGQVLTSGGPRLLTPTWSSPMDLNGDCAVDGNDLGVLLASWGAPDFDPRCDFNGDGIVDGHDLGTLLGAWTDH